MAKKIKIRKAYILLIGSLIISIFLSTQSWFENIILHLGSFSYFGAFLGGMLFVSTFTVAFGVVILTFLSETMSPLIIAIIAGTGAVVGDFVIFHFVRYSFIDEIKYLFYKFGGHNVKVLLNTKYFAWTLPLVGAFIIASPLPDELGVSLMGLSKIKTSRFLIISFVLNAIGIFFLVSAGNAALELIR